MFLRVIVFAVVTGNVTGDLTGDVTGDVSGNAGTVTNGVYTTGNQTIAGTKTFSSTISGSIDGSAASIVGVTSTNAELNILDGSATDQATVTCFGARGGSKFRSYS